MNDNPFNDNLREQFPNEAELFDKYPRLYEKVNNTIDLLYLILRITLISWIVGGFVLLYLLTQIR